MWSWLNLEEKRARYELAYLRGRTLPRRARLLLYAHFVLRTSLRSEILAKSAALSYTVVFSLVPLITTLLAFLTAFPGLQNQRDNFMALLSGYLLPGAVQGVEERIAHFSERAAAAGSLSSLIFFGVVLMLFQTMELAMNSIWDAEKQRSWTERLRALAFFLILGGMATTLFVAVRERAEEFGLGQVSGASALGAAAATGVNIAIAVALYVLSTKLLPNVKVTWRAAVAGGAVSGVAWHFLKGGFTWYVENMASYDNIYGTLGVIPVFFLWVYLSFLLLLFSACVAYAAQNLESSIYKEQASTRGYPRGYYAVLVAAELQRAFARGEAALTSAQLARNLGIPSFCVADALHWLREGNLALQIPGGGEPCYLPARPGNQVTYLDVVTATSGSALLLAEPEAAHSQGGSHEEVRRVFAHARARLEEALSSHALSSGHGPEKAPHAAKKTG